MRPEGKTSANAKQRQDRPNWLRGLRTYVGFAAAGNLAWEVIQLPLYTIWTTGTPGEQAFAILHCTGGDVLIAVATLTIALIVVGNKHWPDEHSLRVLLMTLALGVGYTIFSEWLNVILRKSWAYSPLMPVVPLFNVGLSPLLQWIVVPVFSLTIAKKASRRFGVGMRR